MYVCKRFLSDFEVFYLFAAKFEGRVMQFLGEKSLRGWSPFKTRIPPLSFYYKEQSMANSNSQTPSNCSKTTFEAKG